MKFYANITKVLIMTIFTFLTACASHGTKVNAEQATKFIKGKTTHAEVITKLGKPDSTSISSDGGKTVSYIYSQSQASLISYVPVIGSLVGGMETEGSIATFSFNKKGLLTDYSVTESGSDVNTGVLSGRKQ